MPIRVLAVVGKSSAVGTANLSAVTIDALTAYSQAKPLQPLAFDQALMGLPTDLRQLQSDNGRVHAYSAVAKTL